MAWWIEDHLRDELAYLELLIGKIHVQKHRKIRAVQKLHLKLARLTRQCLTSDFVDQSYMEGKRGESGVIADGRNVAWMLLGVSRA